MKLLLTVLFTACLYAAKPSVLIVVNVPTDRQEMWNDGFVAAIDLLDEEYNITWFNLFSQITTPPDFYNFDAILVKSNWDWIVDLYARKTIPCDVKKALCISGVASPPSLSEMLYYDVLFYETEWYKNQISAHPHIIHAFGINGVIMTPSNEEVEKEYDFISVGTFSSVKRYHLLEKQCGRKLAIGYISAPNNPVIQSLEQSDVEIMGYIPPEELACYYRRAKKCYVPCQIDGGGERAVLEARSCGTEVIIEPDNPKLLELTQSQIYDHVYYAKKLKIGIETMLSQK